MLLIASRVLFEVIGIAFRDVHHRYPADQRIHRLAIVCFRTIQVAEPLLNEHHSLRIEISEHRVLHAICFDAQKQLNAIRRQIQIELHVLLLSRRGQARAAKGLVPGLHRPFFIEFENLLIERVNQGPQLFRPGGCSAVLVVVKHAALANVIARPVELFNQRIFGGSDLFMKRLFAIPVRGSQRRRALEHQVLEEMGCTELTGRFVERPHVGKDFADNPMLVRPLYDQQSQPVVEDVFANRQIVVLCERRHRKNGGGQYRQVALNSHCSLSCGVAAQCRTARFSLSQTSSSKPCEQTALRAPAVTHNISVAGTPRL